MRAFIIMVLLWGFVALPACEQAEESADPGFTSVFPDGSVFTDGQLLLPDGHVCIGVEPPESAYLASPGPVADVESERPDGDAEADPVDPVDPVDPGAAEPPGPEDPCGGSPATCLGEQPPQWALHDFQPQSCGYEAVYGLDNFKGRPTVAVLLAAW
jgi:hypothetical protein